MKGNQQRILAGLVVASGLALGGLLRPLGRPLLLAALLAMVTDAPFRHLRRRLGGRGKLAAGLLTFGVSCFVLLPLLACVLGAKAQLSDSLEQLRASLGLQSLQDLGQARAKPWLPLFDQLAEVLPLRAESLHDMAGHLLEKVQAAVPTLLGASAGLLGGAGLTLCGLFFFALEGERIVALLRALSPLPRQPTDRILAAIHQIAASSLLGTGASAAFSACVVGTGFLVVGLPHALTCGVITLVAAFIPVMGSALVWGPGVACLLSQGHSGRAVGLAGLCMVGGAISGNVIKPLVLRGNSDMHFGLMLAAILGGLSTFGLLGIFLGPTLVAVTQAVVQIYLQDKRARQIS